jgi:hypothetical protein
MKPEHIRMSVMRTIMQIVYLTQTCVIVIAMNWKRKKNEQLQVSPVSALLSDLQHTNRYEENRAPYL